VNRLTGCFYFGNQLKKILPADIVCSTLFSSSRSFVLFADGATIIIWRNRF